MPVKSGSGKAPLPDGSTIGWTREELSPDEARAFRLEARLRTYRVTTVGKGRDAGAIVGRYDVPGAHLHDFLFGDLYDAVVGPGTGHAVLTIELLDVSPGAASEGDVVP
jgi:hypothetical protein